MNHEKDGRSFKVAVTCKAMDVLCGRGAKVNRHPGNRVFRRLVEAKTASFQELDSNQKLLLAKSIVLAFKSHGSRFIKIESDHWVKASQQEAVTKTMHALRHVISRQRAAEAQNAGRAAGQLPQEPAIRNEARVQREMPSEAVVPIGRDPRRTNDTRAPSSEAHQQGDNARAFKQLPAQLPLQNDETSENDSLSHCLVVSPTLFDPPLLSHQQELALKPTPSAHKQDVALIDGWMDPYPWFDFVQFMQETERSKFALVTNAQQPTVNLASVPPRKATSVETGSAFIESLAFGVASLPDQSEATSQATTLLEQPLRYHRSQMVQTATHCPKKKPYNEEEEEDSKPPARPPAVPEQLQQQPNAVFPASFDQYVNHEGTGNQGTEQGTIIDNTNNTTASIRRLHSNPQMSLEIDWTQTGYHGGEFPSWGVHSAEWMTEDDMEFDIETLFDSG